MSIGNYLKDTKGELKHIVWPNRSEALGYTIAIIIVALFIAFLLGGFDILFTRGIDFIVG